MSAAAGRVVLVVEDESITRMMLVDALEDAGFVTVEAGHADAAVARFATRPDIAAVVTDLRMPGAMDGLGLARWMRSHAPTVPIIIAAGFVSLPDAADLNPCIVRVVTKPYDPAEVARWVAELLDPGPAPAAIPP